MGRGSVLGQHREFKGNLTAVRCQTQLNGPSASKLVNAGHSEVIFIHHHIRSFKTAHSRPARPVQLIINCTGRAEMFNYCRTSCSRRSRHCGVIGQRWLAGYGPSTTSSWDQGATCRWNSQPVPRTARAKVKRPLLPTMPTNRPPGESNPGLLNQ